MASSNLTPADRATRDARVHHLAAEGHSNRAIGRQLGIHHTTVSTILRTTTPPVAPTAPAPPATMARTTPATSGNPPAPRLLHPLDPSLIQDLNCLMDPWTGALPAPIRRYLRAAADARRTSMAATAHRIATEHRTTTAPATGRDHPRPQVAP